ncbi:hypothetical protein OAV21_01470 [bacterium]|nr:hypothetical protein [Verrucomicrobiales bacterium]MDC3255050.1 hypothetical protein [bacterium]MDF1784547.1 hypothetical protein [Verrucomicrobiales bacterium]
MVRPAERFTFDAFTDSLVKWVQRGHVQTDQRDVVWGETNILADGRSMIVPLARGYHAYTKLVVFATALGHVRSCNRRRKDAILTKVLAS